MAHRRPSKLSESFNNRSKVFAALEKRNLNNSLKNFEQLQLKFTEYKAETSKEIELLLAEREQLKEVISKNQEHINELTLRIIDLEEKFKPNIWKSKLSNIVEILQQKLTRRPSKDKMIQSSILLSECCFGNDLDKTQMDKLEFNVPQLLVESIRLLECNPQFMNTVGLYRVSGNHVIVQKLRYKINGNDYTLLRSQKDPHNITGLVKLFFRELKEPLLSLAQIKQAIPEDSIDEFNKKSISYKIDRIKMLLNLMPKVQRSTLRYFVRHLKRVADLSSNEMNAISLSVVSGACICYETMGDIGFEKFGNICLIPNKCIELMIDYNRDIFG